MLHRQLHPCSDGDMRMILPLLILALTVALPRPAEACGADTDCLLGERTYRIYLPDSSAGETVGALIFAHGYRGSAKGVMRNKSLLRLADDLGVALIAPKSAGPDWALPGAPDASNKPDAGELPYFDALIQDVTTRFAIDPDRIVASGFSAGGMLVWNLACHRSDMFAGFIPYSGTFWRPQPERCDTPPANIVHIHGTSDKTVPMTGRPILETHQGDVARAIEMYRAFGAYEMTRETTLGEMACDLRENDQARILALCLFEGGHSFRTKNMREAISLLQRSGAF